MQWRLQAQESQIAFGDRAEHSAAQEKFWIVHKLWDKWVVTFCRIMHTTPTLGEPLPKGEEVLMRNGGFAGLGVLLRICFLLSLDFLRLGE